MKPIKFAYKETTKIGVLFDEKVDSKGRKRSKFIVVSPQARSLMKSIGINEDQFLSNLAYFMRQLGFTSCVVTKDLDTVSCKFGVNLYYWIETPE
jgi:hypothetical protein